MEIKVMLEKGAFLPEKAHKEDAGFDLRTPVNVIVMPHDSAIVSTGVHMLIPEGYVGMIKSKSGLNVRDDIQIEGVVDAHFTGSIVAKLYNNGNKPKMFARGDKITQIVILPIPEVTLTQVKELEATDRGNNGFGSTGR